LFNFFYFREASSGAWIEVGFAVLQLQVPHMQGCKTIDFIPTTLEVFPIN